MRTADKILLGLCMVFFLAAGVALLIPSARDNEVTRGVLGSLGIQFWVLCVIVMALSAVTAGLLLANNIRRKRGRPPL